MIYQIHPVHGRHMPINHLESALNEKSGWKTVSETEFYAHGKQTQQAPVLVPEVIEEHIDKDTVDLYVMKFGKKPHHRMKLDSVLAAINGDD